MIPSAPAAMAARAIGDTISHRPVPWLGSTMIGRWLSFFTTGTALMSSVLRVAFSNVRMPRSQRMTCELPSLSTYSALISSSSIVPETPRLISTGFLQRPTDFSRLKFWVLRAPIWRTSATSATISTSRVSMTSVMIGMPTSCRTSAR